MSRRSARLRRQEPDEDFDPNQYESTGSASSSSYTSNSQSILEEEEDTEPEVVHVSDSETENEEHDEEGLSQVNLNINPADPLLYEFDVNEFEAQQPLNIAALFQDMIRQHVDASDTDDDNDDDDDDDDDAVQVIPPENVGEIIEMDYDEESYDSMTSDEEDAEQPGSDNDEEVNQNNGMPNENAAGLNDLPPTSVSPPLSSIAQVINFHNVNRNDDENGGNDEEDHGENGPRPQKIAKLDCSIKSDIDEDGCICSICYDKFTNSGGHRLCCLKCGHVFGKECIEKWIATQKRCPQCNCKAVKKDIRIIYVKNLTAVDTSELDRAKEEVNNLKMERNRIELSNSHLRFNLQAKSIELKRVQEENEQLRNNSKSVWKPPVEPCTSKSIESGNQSSFANLRMPKLYPFKHFDIKEGQCRVGAYNDWMNLLIVSHNISSPLFPGGSYGFKKINCLDFKAFQSFPVHQKALRDMAFSDSNYHNDLLLTVGLDKKAVLFNCSSNCNVQTFSTSAPLWSCCWSTVHPTIFYVGNSQGAVVSYDIRSPLNVLQSFTIPTADRSAVVRMKFVPPAYQSQPFNMTGLLVQKLNSVWFSEMAGNDDLKYHQLPIDGPFSNVDFEPSSRHVLVSCRPKVIPRVHLASEHMVCALGKTYSEPEQCNVFSCDVVQSITGGFQEASMICRSSIFSPQQGQVYLAANGEGPKTVRVWDVGNTDQKSLLRLNYEPALDFIHAKVNNNNYLGIVAERAMDVFEIKEN